MCLGGRDDYRGHGHGLVLYSFGYRPEFVDFFGVKFPSPCLLYAEDGSPEIFAAALWGYCIFLRGRFIIYGEQVLIEYPIAFALLVLLGWRREITPSNASRG